MEPEKYYNISKTAQLLDLSRPTVYKLISTGELKAEKQYGHHTRVSETEIKRFLGIKRTNYEALKRKIFSGISEEEFAEKISELLFDSGCKQLSFSELRMIEKFLKSEEK